jgi:hypothetical protein
LRLPSGAADALDGDDSAVASGRHSATVSATAREAAGELPHVDLGDALAVCLTIREAEPQRFERAALRWLARFCVERREATLAEVQSAASAFENIADEPAALDTLQRLCTR